MQGVLNRFQSVVVTQVNYSIAPLLLCMGLFIVLFTLISTAEALGAEVAPASSAQSLAVVQQKPSGLINSEVSDIVSQQLEALKVENNLLKQKVSTLAESQNAKAQLQNSSNDSVTFPIWTSILLGCVAVIVTTLGVGLAIFSYFGYREAMRRSAEIAKDTAAEVAKSEIIRKMENGDFKKVIEEAIDRVAFGSFQVDMDDVDEN